MAARKTAVKPPEPVVEPAPVVAAVPEQPEQPETDSADPAPEVVEASEPVYLAARKMQRNGEVIKVGDVIEDAGSWPRLESWIRAGYVKESA